MDTHIGRGAQHFAKRANELTGGQVTIRLFPNAGLGSEQQALEGMQAGTVDMGFITVYTNAVKLGRRPRPPVPLPRLRPLEEDGGRDAGADHCRGRARSGRTGPRLAHRRLA